MQAMLSRSPLASYSFSNDHGTNIHICYQDGNGNIGQIFYDDRQGWRPGTNGVVGRADLNTGIAMIVWDGGKQERVYYIRDGILVERCHSEDRHGWCDGMLTGFLPVAHYSQLAAMVVQYKKRFIRVYCQNPDNVIYEVCKDGEDTWHKGKSFGAAIAGSSIAASHSPGPREWDIRVFFQRTNTQLVEWPLFHKGVHGWKEGTFKPQLLHNPGAYIACASYGKGDHRVFTVDRDNKLCVTESIIGTEGWREMKQLTTVIPQSSVAAALLPGSVPRVRVYLQVAPGQIAEWGTDDWRNYSLMRAQLPSTAAGLAPGNVPWVRVSVQVGHGQAAHAQFTTPDGMNFSATDAQISTTPQI
ncbi:hypothetical protein DFP73DRAFT_560864 [Morchella snyderi]|nr:hypothetical protein DFP73DRAFT_560864 [Morchella snyderi]